MKSILISIQPKWVALEMNGIKKIEVRKTAPKDWKDYLSGKTKEMPKPITVYIYCTNDKNVELHYSEQYGAFCDQSYGMEHYSTIGNGCGKIIAKFTLNKIEKINVEYFDTFNGLFLNNLLQKSCLTIKQIDDYLGNKSGYAWHISDLQILTEPKSIRDCAFMSEKLYKKYQRDLQQAYEEDDKTLARLYSGCALEDECANCVELVEMTKHFYYVTTPPQSYIYVYN